MIGPGGVFAINTKYHPDANVWVAGENFWVNGQRQVYVRASRAEGRKVAQLLTAACGIEVKVSPLIVVVGAANGFKVKEQPPGVVVFTRRHIVDWLRSQPAELASETVEAIYSVAVFARPGPGLAPKVRLPVRVRAQLPKKLRPQSTTSLPKQHRGLVRQKIVVKYSGALGLRVLGDPRPHEAVTKSADLRWSRAQRCWNLPNSRGRAPDILLIGRSRPAAGAPRVRRGSGARRLDNAEVSFRGRI